MLYRPLFLLSFFLFLCARSLPMLATFIFHSQLSSTNQNEVELIVTIIQLVELIIQYQYQYQYQQEQI